MKTIIKWIVIIVVGFIVLGALLPMCSDESAETSSALNTSSDDAPVTVDENVQESSVVEPPEETLTSGQRNAIRSAKDYISFAGFSREGLINQLSSEYGDGYSVEDATYAADNLNIDWNEQAKKSAENYLSVQGFSCDGLIKQLSSDAGDKYTKEQAEYGAKAAGACD